MRESWASYFTRHRCASQSASSRALTPGRRGKPRLTRSELLGPDDCLLAVLPLNQQILVGDLDAVLVHLEGPEDGMVVHLENRLSDLRAVQRAGPLHGFHQDLAAAVAGRVEVRGLGASELLPVRLDVLLGPGILAGNRDQPARAERDELRLP